MYLKKLELPTTDKWNYSIEISSNNDNIFFSIDEKGYLIPINDIFPKKSKSKFINKSYFKYKLKNFHIIRHNSQNKIHL